MKGSSSEGEEKSLTEAGIPLWTQRVSSGEAEGAEGGGGGRGEPSSQDLCYRCTLISRHLIGYDDAGASLQVHAEALPPEGELTLSVVAASHCALLLILTATRRLVQTRSSTAAGVCV